MVKDRITYRIQVASSRKKIKDGSGIYKDFEDLWYYDDNGQFKYTTVCDDERGAGIALDGHACCNGELCRDVGDAGQDVVTLCAVPGCIRGDLLVGDLDDAGAGAAADAAGAARCCIIATARAKCSEGAHKRDSNDFLHSLSSDRAASLCAA